MTWHPTDDTDYMIRKWMGHRGWHVHGTDFNHEQQVYSWRHQPGAGSTIVLRITRTVLEDFPPFALWELLDRLHVAAELKARPEAYLVMVKRGMRALLEEYPEEPDSR
jgi:hypothetical protein